MIRKNTLVALVVFVILLAAGLAVQYRPLERGMDRISLADVPVASCDRIEITGPRGIVLRQQEGKWQLPSNRAADMDTVEQFFAAVQRLQSSDLITQDPTRYAELEVDSSKGHTVSLYQGSKLLTSFVLGKSGQMDLSLRQGDNVYRILHAHSGQFLRSPAEWLDRRMHPDDVKAAVRLEVALHDKPPYALVPVLAAQDSNQVQWQFADMSIFPADFRFDHEVASGEVTTLLQMRANELLDKDPGEEVTGLHGQDVDMFTWYVVPKVLSEPTLLQKAIAPEEVANLGGVKRTMVIGKPQDDNSVYARMEGNDTIYTLSKYTVGTLRRGLEDFRQMTLMKDGDIHQVSKLIIANGSKPIVLVKEGASQYAFAKESLQPPSGFRLDPLKVLRRLASVVHARAGGIAANQDVKQAGLLQPQRYVKLIYEDGHQETLALGKAVPDGGGAFYGMGSRDQKVYNITNYFADSILAGFDSFKPDADAMGQMANPQDLPPDVRQNLEQQQDKREKEQELLRQIRKQQAKTTQQTAPTSQTVQESNK